MLLNSAYHEQQEPLKA